MHDYFDEPSCESSRRRLGCFAYAAELNQGRFRSRGTFVNVPAWAERELGPLLWGERLKFSNEGLAFVVNDWPHRGRRSGRQ